MAQRAPSHPINHPPSESGTIGDVPVHPYTTDTSTYIPTIASSAISGMPDSQLDIQSVSPLPPEDPYQSLQAVSPLLPAIPSGTLQDPTAQQYPLVPSGVDNPVEPAVPSTAPQTVPPSAATQRTETQFQASDPSLTPSLAHLQKQIEVLMEQNRIISQRLLSAEASGHVPPQSTAPQTQYNYPGAPSAEPSKAVTSLSSLPSSLPQPSQSRSILPPPYHVPSMQAVLAKPRRLDPPNEIMDEQSLRFLEQLLSSFPPTKRAMLEKKNKGYLLHYARIYPMLQTKQRFRGYFKANLSRERQTGWIACSAFPDNVFCDLRQMDRRYSQIAEPGFAVEFSVTLNQREQSVFSAVNVIVFTADQVAPEEKERYVCVYFASGRGCKKGYECPFLHVLPGSLDARRYSLSGSMASEPSQIPSRRRQQPHASQFDRPPVYQQSYMYPPTYIPTIRTQPSQPLTTYYNSTPTSIPPTLIVDSPATYIAQPVTYSDQPTYLATVSSDAVPMNFVLDQELQPATVPQAGYAPQAQQIQTLQPHIQQLSPSEPSSATRQTQDLSSASSMSIPTIPVYTPSETLPEISTTPTYSAPSQPSASLIFEDNQLSPY